ncbi:hypothetical protein JW935_25975 [candidate division KSB1 bacterium]|nr:hypothetical protein [candidate division KSB1 bacterium]
MNTRRKDIRFGRLLFGILLLLIQCQKQRSPFPVLALEGSDYQNLQTSTFIQIKYAGFTISYSSFSDPQLNKKALDYAESAGIKLILSDQRINSFILNEHSIFSELDAAVKDYHSHPAFFGYMLDTEIAYDRFERISAVKKYLHNRDPLHPSLIIIQPLYASPSQLQIDDYSKYIDNFLKIVDPELFCLNYFPVTQSGPLYFSNLQICYDLYRTKGVKFWGTVLSLSFAPYPQIKHSYLRFQAYCSLAYGARGLTFYSFYLPRDQKWVYQEALVDPAGEKTPLLSHAATINGEIEKIGTTLMHLTPKGVYHSEPVTAGCFPLSPDLGIQNIHGRDIIAAFFSDEVENEYVLLINKNFSSGSKPRIYFHSRITQVIEMVKNENDPLIIEWESDTTEKSYPILFQAGDGRLFRLMTRSIG